MTEASITARIAALQEMSLGEIRGEFEKVFGKPSLSRNRKVLIKRIAEKIQAEEAGSKPEAAKAKVDAPKPTLTVKFERKGKGKAAGKPKKAGKEKPAKPHHVGQRDPRLPKVGTTITKQYKGKTLNVRVLEQGFEYQGKPYRSLSAIAKAVTGSIWNGFLFWGLVKREGKKS